MDLNEAEDKFIVFDSSTIEVSPTIKVEAFLQLPQAFDSVSDTVRISSAMYKNLTDLFGKCLEEK